MMLVTTKNKENFISTRSGQFFLFAGAVLGAAFVHTTSYTDGKALDRNAVHLYSIPPLSTNPKL